MIDVRPAASRFHTTIDWLDSWHSFSFGEHRDPANVNHGLLIVSNDDVVAPASGFGTHGHRDMEVVTWVLEGTLEHRDSEGNHAVIRPGLAQRMSAGSGIRHSEWNPSRDEPVRLIQMWVLPDTKGIRPGYQDADVGDALAAGGLVKIASGGGDAAIHIHQADAAMYVARLAPGESVVLPDARHLHVFVAIGAVELEGTGALHEGDAARATDAGARTLTAGVPSEVIVWATA
jgi:redox-sensitive bicupin YhaK (pirin superfamily)